MSRAAARGLSIASAVPARLSNACDCYRSRASITTNIKGYYTEEFTHLAVAAAIASGVADAGIGIEAAARRLKLDFIPLFVEDYYLLGKRETVERADVEAIVATLSRMISGRWYKVFQVTTLRAPATSPT